MTKNQPRTRAELLAMLAESEHDRATDERIYKDRIEGLLNELDLIPRAEHEAALAEARAVVAKDATPYNDHIVDANKMVEPADAEPVGWVADRGEAGLSSVLLDSEGQATRFNDGGPAVPLYRHPVNVEIVLDEYGPGIEGKQVLAMCDGKLLKCVHLTDLLPADAARAADFAVEPADAEPIGYANRMSDGAWSGVYASKETAQSVAQYGGWDEIAVPLYRNPAPPEVEE